MRMGRRRLVCRKERTQSINEEGEDDDSGEKMAESRVLIWEMREEKRGKEKTREMRMKGD